jgi:predicted DNA-binding transcriptional regulator AlpA
MFSFDEDRFRQIIREEVESVQAKQEGVPKLMDTKELMAFLGVSRSKASELLKRADFPVIRELGHPRVPAQQLMQWIDRHTEWVEENTDFLKAM